MHQYLKAIGFGELGGKRKLNEILEDTKNNFSHHELVAQDDDEMDFCEYQKEYGAGIGIGIYGDMDIHEKFYMQYYYPYFIGTGITSYADVYIEKRMDRESYVGICEDMKVGISLIFYVQNIIEYLKERQRTESIKYKSVTLSGLCDGGMILLPVRKNKSQEKQQKEEVHNRMMLMSAARTGDPAAIESLTLDDIDIYSKVSRRLISEDVFTIVDTYIMPYGIECDRYSILGEILKINRIENEYTQEELYVMSLEVNGLTFDVCVPVKCVVGEPAVGRRFKGNIWMQGIINF